jgi:cytochrome c peroxidase
VALASRAAAARYGLWLDSERGVAGVVRARMADGSTALALSCATCHAAPGAARVEDGLPNARLDIGSAIVAQRGSALAPGERASLLAWGPGRLDVTTQLGAEPARIPDLRPVRWLTHLHQDATLAVREATLAIRIETLIVTSSGQVIRPPRVVALALATYVESLAAALPPAPEPRDRGATLFAAHCTGCHAPPGFAGPPVPLDIVGTDPTLGSSPERGTHSYRVPSLRGVGTRGPLLHDGSVPSVAALLDPARLTPAFSARLHGSGAVPGHDFGLDLPAVDRELLIAYVSSL